MNWLENDLRDQLSILRKSKQGEKFQMNNQVIEYIQQIDQTWQVELCNRLRQVIHRVIPNVTEQVKYKQANYSLEGNQVCVFFPAKNWVNVTLFQAETLEAPEGFFEPATKPDRKTIKIRSEQVFDEELFAKLIKQVADQLVKMNKLNPLR